MFELIHAVLTGAEQCEADGFVARSTSPVLALCRMLVAAGYDPARPLHVYRGDVLCLRVRSIGEGARLRVAAHGVGFERLPECTAASPMSETLLALAAVAWTRSVASATLGIMGE